MLEAVRLLAGLVVIGVAVRAVLRGVDVRLALFPAALALGALAGDPGSIIRTFLNALADAKSVVPICCAMGFAYVLRHTGCDRHLVHLLVAPLRRVRALLLPGTVLIGYAVNVPIISQASTSVAIGSVLIPLLASAEISPAAAGSALLLGASVGGELLNPGAPEYATVAKTSGEVSGAAVKGADCVRFSLPMNLAQLGVALLVFWPITVRAEARAKQRSAPAESVPETNLVVPATLAASPVPLSGSGPPGTGEDGDDARQGEGAAGVPPEKVEAQSDCALSAVGVTQGAVVRERADADATGGSAPGAAAPFRIDLLRALIPVLPLLILFLTARFIDLQHPGQSIQIIPVPQSWLVSAKEMADVKGAVARKRADELFDSRLIGAAMLIGTAAAALSVLRSREERKAFLGTARAFFEGAGYAYTEIIAIIVIAACFAEGVRLIGIGEIVGHALRESPALLVPAAGFVTLLFAFIGGSGIAATQGLFGFFAGPAMQAGIHPAHVGAITSLGGAAGRTMSPVAAVNLACCRLTGAQPADLSRRVAVPLIAGLAAAVIVGMILAPYRPAPAAQKGRKPGVVTPPPPKLVQIPWKANSEARS